MKPGDRVRILIAGGKSQGVILGVHFANRDDDPLGILWSVQIEGEGFNGYGYHECYLQKIIEKNVVLIEDVT